MRSSLARWQYALDVPLAHREERDRGIDTPSGQIVTSGRPVVDLDAFAPDRRVAHDAQMGWFADLHGHLGEVECVLEPRDRSRERARRIAAGDREECPSGGEEGETLGRCQTQRPRELLGEADRDELAVVDDIEVIPR